MVRWMRFAAAAALVASLLFLGVGVGLFLVANSGWIAVTVPPWLTGIFGDPSLELWLPALIAGWFLAVVAIAILLGWSMFYVWRRQQYESLIGRMERELSELRNLPFTAPAPLEDLPEKPSAEVAAILAFSDLESRGADRKEPAGP